MNLLQRRVHDLFRIHGSTRAAGKALGVDHAYLHRIAAGEKRPSDEMLEKLGIERVETYRRKKKNAALADQNTSAEGAQT